MYNIQMDDALTLVNYDQLVQEHCHTVMRQFHDWIQIVSVYYREFGKTKLYIANHKGMKRSKT